MLKNPAFAASPAPDEATVRECLGRVLASPGFSAAPRLTAFLRFVVEEALQGHESEIKETTIATRVFGRPADFDPRFDSVVRAQATLLRRRLRDYFADAPAEAMAIEIPRGTYVPVFRLQAAPVAEPAAPEPPGPPEPSKRRFWRFPALAAGLLVVAGLAAWWLVPSWRRPTPSIAVLPFTDLGSVADTAHIGDGFVEDLTTDLAQEPGLRVVARTSAFQFRGKSEDVRKIGWQLGVLAVLEGSVRTQNGQVRVTAQLIDARTGYHLWSSGYEREMAGLRDVAADIRRAVNCALGVEEAPASARRAVHTPPPEALDEYWRGRYIKSDWQRFEESLPHFERAAAIDPLFAEAWAAQASVHAEMEFQAMAPVDQEAASAKAAARRALQLDPRNAEAHAALGSLGYSYDYDWTSSERYFRRALELNPSSAGVRRTYALALTAHGRFDDAFEQLALAQQSDPLSVLTNNNRSTTLFCARRYVEAESEARRHLQMDPGYFLAYFVIGNCQAETGRLAEAIESFRKVLDRVPEALEVMGRLGNAQARLGRTEEARVTLANLTEIQRTKGTAAVALARTAVGLGEKPRAIEWLRQAAAAHLTDAAFMAVDPAFEPLRREPEFRALCASKGLPVPAGK